MNEIMERVIDGLTISMQENGASIILDNLPTISVDESQMLQVMQNLVNNAIKFHGPDRPVVHVSATEQERWWTLSVHDNGTGLNMDYSERIFPDVPASSHQGRIPRSGVGLAIVKKVVERHGAGSGSNPKRARAPRSSLRCRKCRTSSNGRSLSRIRTGQVPISGAGRISL
jgi:light-regulated signal transduction histidine kinase (bacteriophytochrome)